MTQIRIVEQVGPFAEDKDAARQLRTEILAPELKKGRAVTLDFSGVQGATQSFVHALVSHEIRESKGAVLDKIRFKGCSPSVRKIVRIVAEYSQSSNGDE